MAVTTSQWREKGERERGEGLVLMVGQRVDGVRGEGRKKEERRKETVIGNINKD